MPEEKDELGEEELIVKEKRPWLKYLIILLIVIPILTIGLIYGVPFVKGIFGLGGGAGSAGPIGPEVGPIFTLEPFVANLADQPGTRFIKVEVHLEMSDEKLAEELERRRSQVRESILWVLTSKTVEEVLSPQGKGLLKEEIAARVNSVIITGGTIRNVYFQDFVVQ